MASAVGNCCGGGGTRTPYAGGSIIIPHHHSLRFFTLSFSPRNLNNLHVVSAKKFSPRTGKNRRGSSTTTQDQEDQRPDDVVLDAGDGYFLPELPGDKPDFWEGSQWDALGFFVQYLWAFGIVFAVMCWNPLFDCWNDVVELIFSYATCGLV